MSREQIVDIQSGDRIADYTQNARVFAGPGAGKTYWLVEHIRHVVAASDRLGGGRKIACISYTNVAVSEILARLRDSAHLVEATTIHSFLYKFVVRPYLHLLRADDGTSLVNHAAVDGHDEHKPSPGLVGQWIRAATNRNIAIPEAASYLRRLKWQHDEYGDWSLKTTSFVAVPKYLPTTQLKSYKPLYWERGIIDHDDVLYFAHRILTENSELLRFLAARFPYIFVDEFQDTSPIQTDIVTWFANSGSTVVLIGDREQSIYAFQGASPDDFDNFNAPDLASYVIAGNRRSTRQIVKFLNSVRRDSLVQESLVDEDGPPVEVLIGDLANHLRRIGPEVGRNSDTVCLVWTNEEVETILLPKEREAKPWEELEKVDWNRAFFLSKVFRSLVWSAERDFSTAVREVSLAFRIRDRKFRDPVKSTAPASELIRRAASVATLEYFAQGRKEILAKDLLDIYTGLSDHLSETCGLGLTQVREGKFRTTAKGFSGQRLFSSMRGSGGSGKVRTIHSAKGAEFENVIVRLKDPRLASEFLCRSGNDKEPLRLFYVAASRAKRRLFFSVPELSTDARAYLEAEGLTILEV